MVEWLTFCCPDNVVNLRALSTEKRMSNLYKDFILEFNIHCSTFCGSLCRKPVKFMASVIRISTLCLKTGYMTELEL